MAHVQNIFGEILDAMMDVYGTPTTIVGVADTINATWSEAEISRVQQYLDDNELRHSVYEVSFPAEVLDAPWNLAMDSELVNGATGWHVDVRKISAPDMSGGLCNVHVIGVVLQRPNTWPASSSV